MEIQFQKTVIPCLKKLCHQYLSQEQTQEIRLPEGMPDIGTVLSAWGQVIIRSKEWHNGSAGVTGGVMVWVLYLPEDGSGVQQIESWLPFQQSWDIPDTGRDGNLEVIPMLRSVDARTLTARKMMIRASIGMLGNATVPDEMEFYTPSELPKDVQVLKNTYPVRLPVEAGEKSFYLEEKIPFSNTEVPPEKILRFWLLPTLSEWKVVSDKLVLRGVANIGVLYLGADGQLHSWNFDLPFSQYAQISRDYEPNTQADITFAVTNLELEPGEENTWSLKAGISGQYTLYDTHLLELTEDAYSVRREVTPKVDTLRLPAVLESQKEAVLAQQSASEDMLRVVDVSFYPESPTVRRQEDKLIAELAGNFQILGYSPDGELQTATARWQSDMPMNADASVALEMLLQPDGAPTAAPGAGGVSLQSPLSLKSNVTMEKGLEMVTALELGEISEPDPTRPSLILRRAGEDSLWDIAKDTGSSVEAIQAANGIDGEPTGSKMLLIPIL